MFHQLDVRADKTWVKKRATVMLYIEILNLYHRKNVEFILPGPTDADTETIYGLPFFPSFGLEVTY